MVKEIVKTIYKCPYCEDEFDNENDCESHIDDCLDREYAEEDEKINYECEFCGKSFEDEDEAELCEKNHQDNEDTHFSRIRLQKASEHPSQIKLILNKTF